MMRLNQDIVRQSVNLTAIIAAFITNILANIAPLNSLTIGEISNTLFKEVLIIPANYAFAIWGLIYLGLISLAVYQALPKNRHKPYLQQLGYWLSISSVAQILWVLLFQYQLFWWSVVLMLIILLSLIILYWKLKTGLKSVSTKTKWLVNIPISIYLAWISVATIVNLASALYSINWQGWNISPSLWTTIMMGTGTILATTAILQRQDRAYGGVVVWALIAIGIRQREDIILAGTAMGLAIILLFLIFISVVNSNKKIRT